MAKFDLLGVNLTDTLNASGLAAAATSATLTTGAFGSPSGLQLLVLDYDVPAKIEVVSCTISGTALTSITRGLSGTADVTHAASAKVLHTVTPTHWAQVRQGIYQTVQNQTGAVATGTTLIPFDDTIPQITEGIEVLTQAITPSTSANLLFIEVIVYASHSVASNLSIALFQDATASALASGFIRLDANTGVVALPLTHKMTAGTTSATTFRVRIGADSAGTTTLNGSSGSRIHGGVLASSIRITELNV